MDLMWHGSRGEYVVLAPVFFKNSSSRFILFVYVIITQEDIPCDQMQLMALHQELLQKLPVGLGFSVFKLQLY